MLIVVLGFGNPMERKVGLQWGEKYVYNGTNNKLSKSNLHYTLLISFWVSQVSKTHLRHLRQGSYFKVAAVESCWQRMRDLIG